MSDNENEGDRQSQVESQEIKAIVMNTVNKTCKKFEIMNKIQARQPAVHLPSTFDSGKDNEASQKMDSLRPNVDSAVAADMCKTEQELKDGVLYY